MPDPAKTTEKEAYKKFNEALSRGQSHLDRLDPEVKKLAKGPAEASLGEEYDPAYPTSGDEPTSLEAYPTSQQEVDPAPEAPLLESEEYKSFIMPQGMSYEESEAWKEGVDDRLLESDERLQERIESAHPADQAKDLLRRASEGDLEAIKEIGYLGLNIAAMSPIGQIPQMGADAGVGFMDLAEGDYTGAAISGAAIILPITAGMLKAAIKNPVAAKLVSKLDDVEPDIDIARVHVPPDKYINHLVKKGAAEDIAKLSDDELIDAYRGLSEANIVIRKGPYTGWRSQSGLDTAGDAFARTDAAKELLKKEIQDRAFDNPAIAKKFAQRMAKVDKGTVLERRKHLKSYTDEMSVTLQENDPKELMTYLGDLKYEKAEALRKNRGVPNAATEEIDEYIRDATERLAKGKAISKVGPEIATLSKGISGAEAFKQDRMKRTREMFEAGFGRNEPELASPKFGLADQGADNIVEDLGPLLPEDINLLGDTQARFGLTDAELRELRDEFVAYGYDDFPGKVGRR
jgi:hypothetical protein